MICFWRKAPKKPNIRENIKKIRKIKVGFEVVLFSVLLLIMAAFELHDIVIGNLTVNEAAELYGHLPENGDRERIEQYGNERLKTVLSDIGYTMKIEEYRDGSRVELEFADGQREFEDSGSRPEKMMRAMTLLDAFTED